MNEFSELNALSIKNERDKMHLGDPVDTNIVSPIVYKSWKRSMQVGVDPFDRSEKIYLTKQEVKKFFSEIHNDVYAELKAVLREIASSTKLSFLLYKNNGELKDIFAVSKQLETYIPRDISENVFGTNAACLAMEYDTAIQLLGEEHFYETPIECIAIPVHDYNGDVKYIFNVGGIKKNEMEMLGIATSIVQMIENDIKIKHILDERDSSNAVFNNILNHLHSGIVYIDENNRMNYNDTLLGLFEIEGTLNEKSIRENIETLLFQIKEFRDRKEIDHKEIIIKIKNRRKSYLATLVRISIGEAENKGFLVVIDDINKVLGVNFKKNSAVYTFDDIVGENITLLEAKELARKASNTKSAILIQGDSGTGKELFAQAIHNESNRKDYPFVAINCGAIPSELIESELFGYEPGAFTGAKDGIKLGKLEAATGGTFFFDEIESMPLNVQVKLLRALSSSKITRIGGIEDIPIDIRIISATKKDLLKEVEEGSFREDLFYRINIINIIIPSLKERKDDIIPLAKNFIGNFYQHENLVEPDVDPEFYDALAAYFWRGNVRELKNVIEKATLLNDDKKLTLENLPPEIVEHYKYESLKDKIVENLSETDQDKSILQIGEEIIIEMVLTEENWNLTKSAARLGLSRPTLYKKINKNDKLKQRKNSLQ